MGKKKAKPRAKPNKKAVMAGYDFGLPFRGMVVPSIDFVQNLQDADIVGCGHFEESNEDFGVTIPTVALIARHADKLQLALRQLASWIDFTGPDAADIRINIVGDGYEVSVGPDFTHLMWRSIGLANFADYQAVTPRFVKRIDTRHPNVDRIAEYSKRPIAPVCFTGLVYNGSEKSPRFADPRSVSFAQGMPRLTLLHMQVYRTSGELPIDMRKPTKDELESSRREYEASMHSAAALHESRERRLKSQAPATMHMLRNSPDVTARVAELVVEGLEPWLIEQACVNQQIWDKASASTKYKLGKTDTIARVLADYVEIETPAEGSILVNKDEVKTQVGRDLRFLLQGLGHAKLPLELDELQSLLGRLGHLKAAQP